MGTSLIKLQRLAGTCVLVILATLAGCSPMLHAQSSPSQTNPSGVESYSPPTAYDNSFCSGGQYPEQWQWNPSTSAPAPAPATSGTPRMVQIRQGQVIATYSTLGGDAGYSKPNSANGSDPSVGPFRRAPYTQWQEGDVFEIYPAVYNGAKMQIYIGPNVANDAAYNAGIRDIPRNITIRGVTVNGQRPVIVNPPTGASNATFGQSLIYIDGRYDAQGKLIAPATNITIENIDIVDSPSGGNIGKAAIYANGVHNLTLRNIRISGFKQHSANGLFATSNMSGTLLLDNVELGNNGGAGGPEHNAYVNGSKTDPNFTFHFRGSWSHSPFYGHALKSRAQRTVIEGSYLAGSRAAPGQQTEAYLLDVPEGGVLIARNNVFVKNFSGNNSNGASLTYGVEKIDPARTWQLLVEHNTFVAFSKTYDDAAHPLYPLFIKSGTPGTKTVNANVFVGYCASGNATRDFRGSNYSELNFNQIDQGFRPRQPVFNGSGLILGTPQYSHQSRTLFRRSNALGARD